MWVPQLTSRLTGILAVTPGWYGDFEVDVNDTFRFTGKAILRYDWLPERLQLVLGVLYLDRLNTKVLPVGGIIWKPNDDLSFDLVFPQSKIAQRISCGMGFENWLYVSAGFGGNTWTIQRAATDPDELNLVDWRLMLGWEHRRNGGAGARLEVGYVFSREIEFRSQPIVYELDDTAMLRGVLTF
jgi:hypothetical protein